MLLVHRDEKGNTPVENTQSDIDVERSESPNSYLDQECRGRFPLVEDDSILYCYEYDQHQEVLSHRRDSTPTYGKTYLCGCGWVASDMILTFPTTPAGSREAQAHLDAGGIQLGGRWRRLGQVKEREPERWVGGSGNTEKKKGRQNKDGGRERGMLRWVGGYLIIFSPSQISTPKNLEGWAGLSEPITCWISISASVFSIRLSSVTAPFSPFILLSDFSLFIFESNTVALTLWEYIWRFIPLQTLELQ